MFQIKPYAQHLKYGITSTQSLVQCMYNSEVHQAILSTTCTHGVISKAKLGSPSDSASQVHVPENSYHEWWA